MVSPGGLISIIGIFLIKSATFLGDHWMTGGCRLSKINSPIGILAGGLEHELIFPYIGNVIIPTDFHIFQRGRYTTNQDNIIILLPQKGHNMAQQKCVVAAVVH